MAINIDGGNDTPKEAKTAAGRTGAMNASTVFSQYNDDDQISPEGTQYLDEVKKYIIKNTRMVDIKANFITDSTIVFSAKNSSIALTVIELMHIKDDLVDISTNYQTSSVITKFRKNFPDNKLLNVVIANRFMFGRSAQMAKYIFSALFANTDANLRHLTLDDFNSDNSNLKLFVDPNPAEMRRFFNKRSPMASNVRDFGFVCYESVATRDQDQGREPRQQRNPILAVSAYVEFILTTSQTDAFSRSATKFIPVVHITEIWASAPTTKMLGIALPLAAEFLIGEQAWLKQFVSEGNINQNIGNLVLDTETGLPYESKDEYEVQDMFREYFTPNKAGRLAAHLVLDYTVGAPNIPGMDKFAMDDQKALFDEFGKFYGDKSGSGVFTAKMGQELTGYAEIRNAINGDDIVDLRQCTYLYMCATVNQFDQNWSLLLERPRSEQQGSDLRRFDNCVNLIGGNITPTYKVIQLTINGSVAEQMSNIVRNKINISTSIASEEARLVLPDINSTFSGGFRNNNNMGNSSFNVVGY